MGRDSAVLTLERGAEADCGSDWGSDRDDVLSRLGRRRRATEEGLEDAREMNSARAQCFMLDQPFSKGDGRGASGKCGRIVQSWHRRGARLHIAAEPFLQDLRTEED